MSGKGELMSELLISKILSVYSGHIQGSTVEFLNDDKSDISAYEHPYGWFIHIYFEMEKLPMPEDLLCLIKLALANDCRWINLDCEGAEIEGLPTYDW
jgi:hypothetical protein